MTFRFLARRLPILLAILLASALAFGIPYLLTRRSVPALTPPAPSCILDPNQLPPPPPSPDGRLPNFLHTCGGKIYDAQGHEIRIAGINWSGMEEGGYAPGGLGNRSLGSLLDQIKALGYNTIRLPFSSEAVESGQQVGNINYGLNPDLQGLSWLGLLDQIVAGARQRGLRVILDRHQPTSSGRIDLWYDSTVSEARWIADWEMLAAHYAGNDTVIAFDLSNEPHGAATWGTGDPATDWHLAAEKAGNAVLAKNPYLLIFVEGVENYQGDHYWWGGNLLGVQSSPVVLSVPHRVVYSPHDYGPAISDQAWFHDPRYPLNLPGEWDRHWGYIEEQGIAPVVLGEFGGWSFGSDPDGLWQRTLVAYLAVHHFSALVWSLNPSWDTGGILNGDWQSVNVAKQQAYTAILAPPIPAGPPPPTPTPRVK
jgi:endoglucanase